LGRSIKAPDSDKKNSYKQRVYFVCKTLKSIIPYKGTNFRGSYIRVFGLFREIHKLLLEN